MIFPTEEEWVAYGITEPAHKFFFLRWQELFDEETFDSWQVRTSSVKTILAEMKACVEVVERVHAHHVNIEHLLEEITELAKKDLVIKRLFPFVPDHITRLKTSYISDVKNQSSLDLPQFKRLINVTLGNLTAYQERLFSSIHDILTTLPGQYKIDLYSLALHLGVELVANGYSVLALRESSSILTTPGTTFIKRFEKLHKEFSGKTHDFECFFLVKCPRELIGIEGFGVSLTRERPANTTEEEDKFYSQNKEGIAAIAKVKAKDVYSARHEGEKRIEDMFAASKLYQKNKDTTLYDYCLVKTRGKYYLIEPDLSRLTYVKDTKTPRARISEFTKVRHSLQPTDVNQLNASLQYHKLATIAPTDESRLVNLWIALESLIQDGGSNIIERITTFVPKTSATGYIGRKIRAFTIDMKDFWQTSKTDALLPSLLNSTQGKIHYKDTLKIIVDKKDGPLISQFATIAAQNELLIYRLSKFVDDFMSPSATADTLERNVSGMTWQLRRIYRTRNFVTHKGSAPSGTRQLIQHLNSYYITTYYNLIFDLLNNPTWRITDALEHRVSMYDYFIDRLRKQDEEPPKRISCDMLLNMSVALHNIPEKGAWDHD